MNDRYQSPLSERYASRQMQHIFSPDMKFKTWRKLWIALAETEKELGLPIYQEQIDELADAVLAKIITEDMTPMEKVQAIFNYIRGHVGYINHSEKDDWIRAAYEGLAEGQGDCYVFACTSKQLLTRAGITNMDIAKIPAKTSHYWNLVDVGEGWYHLDTTPRPDHPTIFLWTDEEMMAYSAWHYNAYNYDRSLYPEIN